MAKRAKTLKTKGFTIESRNKFGKVVFRVSILRYDKGYKKFRVQATPKGEDKRIDRECYSEWNVMSWYKNGKEKTQIHTMIASGERQELR